MFFVQTPWHEGETDEEFCARMGWKNLGEGLYHTGRFIKPKVIKVEPAYDCVESSGVWYPLILK